MKIKKAKPSVGKKAVSQRAAPRYDFESIHRQTDQAFKSAAKAAVAENDSLGIATHGAVRGKLIVRMPNRTRGLKR